MIIDAYAGARGWSEGLRALGLTDIGIELDAAACATAAAAGHRTIRADVAAFPLDHLAGRVDGLIMSPPCQAFSTAGTGAGRQVIDELAAAIGRGDWAWSHDDDRVRHVLEVGRWTETLRPTWVACEQVPPVLPLWHAYVDRWRHLYGWSAWAGIINSADHGVPQTRRRAFLIARTDGQPALPPVPTHAEGGALTLDGELAPWVTMAQALGWGATDRPYPTIAGGTQGGPCYDFLGGSGARSVMLATRESGRWIDRPWPWKFPATTVAGDPRITARCHHDDGTQGSDAKTTEQVQAGDYDGTEPIRLTVTEAATLQGFPPGYPWQGTRGRVHEQVGNAVPPPVAAAVIAALTRPNTRSAAA